MNEFDQSFSNQFAKAAIAPVPKKRVICKMTHLKWMLIKKAYLPAVSVCQYLSGYNGWDIR